MMRYLTIIPAVFLIAVGVASAKEFGFSTLTVPSPWLFGSTGLFIRALPTNGTSSPFVAIGEAATTTKGNILEVIGNAYVSNVLQISSLLATGSPSGFGTSSPGVLLSVQGPALITGPFTVGRLVGTSAPQFTSLSGVGCAEFDTAGLLTNTGTACGGGGGVSGGNPNTLAYFVNPTTLAATSTPIVNAIYASSTTGTSEFAGLLRALNGLGVNTSSPGSQFQVDGEGLITGLLTTGRVYATTSLGVGTSTPASYFGIQGNFVQGGGAIEGIVLRVGTVIATSSVSFPSSSITNAMLANSSLTYAAGNGLTGGGAVSLGGSATIDLGVDSTLTVGADSVGINLGNANTWTGRQTINLASTTSFSVSNLINAAGLGTSTFAGGLTAGASFGVASTGPSATLGVAGPYLIGGTGATSTSLGGLRLRENLLVEGGIEILGGCKGCPVGGGTGTPGGANRNIQFNDASSFGGNASFLFTTGGEVALATTTGSWGKLNVGGLGVFNQLLATSTAVNSGIGTTTPAALFSVGGAMLSGLSNATSTNIGGQLINGGLQLKGYCEGCTSTNIYTANDTWTKPVNAHFVHVIVVGGGGGGAGGEGGALGTIRAPGSGGGGAAWCEKRFSMADLTPTVSITVGAGGTAGTGGSSAAGTDGGGGASSSFGSYLTCYGGGGGKGAVAGSNSGGGGGGTGGAGTTGGAGNVAGGNPACPFLASPGQANGGCGAWGDADGAGGAAEWGGGGGGGNSTTAGQAGGQSIYGCGGGGSGGFVNASEVLAAGAAGGSVGGYSSGGGGAGGSDANGTAGANGNSTICGAGGGGGGGSTTAGRAGGAGGAPGGGGGGGGGMTTTGGAGAAGGLGQVWVFTY